MSVGILDSSYHVYIAGTLPTELLVTTPIQTHFKVSMAKQAQSTVSACVWKKPVQAQEDRYLPLGPIALSLFPGLLS